MLRRLSMSFRQFPVDLGDRLEVLHLLLSFDAKFFLQFRDLVKQLRLLLVTLFQLGLQLGNPSENPLSKILLQVSAVLLQSEKHVHPSSLSFYDTTCVFDPRLYGVLAKAYLGFSKLLQERIPIV